MKLLITFKLSNSRTLTSFRALFLIIFNLSTSDDHKLKFQIVNIPNCEHKRRNSWSSLPIITWRQEWAVTELDIFSRVNASPSPTMTPRVPNTSPKTWTSTSQTPTLDYLLLVSPMIINWSSRLYLNLNLPNADVTPSTNIGTPDNLQPVDEPRPQTKVPNRLQIVNIFSTK